MIVEYEVEVRQEISDAVAHYKSKSPELGGDFILEFDAVVSRILAHPNAWPPIGQGLRRCLMTRFPYHLIYRVEGEIVRVFAVAHNKQRPRYWRRRVKG